MAYKIKQLIENGYDFKSLYPDKQEAVRKQTGLDFYLDSIVKFLQKQTNNFTVDNPIAHDLDNAIYGIVEKFEKENGNKDIKEEIPELPELPKEEVKQEEPVLEKSEEETRQEILEAIELLEMLGDDADEQSKEALEILKSLV